MTEPSPYRQQIAIEAAQLLFRKKVASFAAARKRAARRLKRLGLRSADFPTNTEIQQELMALIGKFAPVSPASDDEADSEFDALDADDFGDDDLFDDDHEDDEAFFAALEVLLEPLAKVRLDSLDHPEGDALYHTLQVFKLGRDLRPYDEDFLLACLLHDIGWAVNPRYPRESALDILAPLVSERVLFLLNQLPAAWQYLRSGYAPKSLRKSPDFEEAILLARCDRDGRVPGEAVDELSDVIDYLRTLRSENG